MRLRPFLTADEAALVDVWFDGWRSTGPTRPVVTRDDLAARAPRELAERWTVSVAELDGQVAAFVALSLAERRLDQLFVAPHAQGRGLGVALFGVARMAMPDGFWLSTQVANQRARTFYSRRAMIVDPTDRGLGPETIAYVAGPVS